MLRSIFAPALDASFVVSFRDDTLRRQAEEAMRQSHANLESMVEHRTAAVRELSASLLRSQDDERRKISRELHDSLGQYLASARMSLDALKRPEANEKERQGFLHLMDTLDKCLTETRTVAHLLHPPFSMSLDYLLRQSCTWKASLNEAVFV